MSDPWAAELEKAGYRVHRRKCSNPQIREVSLSDGPVLEVTCGCGHSSFNIAGQRKVYERHLAQSVIDNA